VLRLLDVRNWWHRVDEAGVVGGARHLPWRRLGEQDVGGDMAKNDENRQREIMAKVIKDRKQDNDPDDDRD
jgi:hypothetical protein